VTCFPFGETFFWKRARRARGDAFVATDRRAILEIDPRRMRRGVSREEDSANGIPGGGWTGNSFEGVCGYIVLDIQGTN